MMENREQRTEDSFQPSAISHQQKAESRKLTADSRIQNYSIMGFTLIEMMVVAAIFGIVVYGLLTMLSAGRTSWSSADTQIALQEELRKAMRQISYDLAQSGAGQINISGDGVFYSAVSFNVSQGASGSGDINWSSEAINYTLSGNQILRAQGSDSRVVANNITNLTFQRQAASSDVVRIGLAVQKETQFSRLLNASLDSAVYLRN